MAETTTREHVPAVIPRDPRAVAAEVEHVRRRLETVYETVRRGFHSVPSTLDAMVAELEADAARRWLLYEFRNTFWSAYRVTSPARLALAVHQACQPPTRRKGKH